MSTAGPLASLTMIRIPLSLLQPSGYLINDYGISLSYPEEDETGK